VSLIFTHRDCLPVYDNLKKPSYVSVGQVVRLELLTQHFFTAKARGAGSLEPNVGPWQLRKWLFSVATIMRDAAPRGRRISEQL